MRDTGPQCMSGPAAVGHRPDSKAATTAGKGRAHSRPLVQGTHNQTLHHLWNHDAPPPRYLQPGRARLSTLWLTPSRGPLLGKLMAVIYMYCARIGPISPQEPSLDCASVGSGPYRCVREAGCTSIQHLSGIPPFEGVFIPKLLAGLCRSVADQGDDVRSFCCLRLHEPAKARHLSSYTHHSLELRM